MATIDKLDLSIYNLYAIRTRMVEQTQQQYRLDEAATIPPQTQLLDTLPKLTELDILLGVTTVSTPWALFLPPKRFRFVRRSPFAFSCITPSIGLAEEHEERMEMLEKIPCSSPEEKREKQTITTLFKQIDTINDWLGHIIGRVGQFLQG